MANNLIQINSFKIPERIYMLKETDYNILYKLIIIEKGTFKECLSFNDNNEFEEFMNWFKSRSIKIVKIPICYNDKLSLKYEEGSCFKNSQNFVKEIPESDYFEGFLKFSINKQTGFKTNDDIIHHGFNLINSNTVDTTLQERIKSGEITDLEYFGIKITNIEKYNDTDSCSLLLRYFRDTKNSMEAYLQL